jgi:hypothetical protein
MEHLGHGISLIGDRGTHILRVGQNEVMGLIFTVTLAEDLDRLFLVEVGGLVLVLVDHVNVEPIH